jgi:hypothetical protein
MNLKFYLLKITPTNSHRYECVDRQWTKRDALYFRLDFSNWYALKPFALSYGSLIAAAAFCAASFVLNIVWIFVRWIVLRWIRRTGQKGGGSNRTTKSTQQSTKTHKTIEKETNKTIEEKEEGEEHSSKTAISTISHSNNKCK